MPMLAGLALAVQSSPADQTPAAEIQVIGRKLKDFRANVTAKGGVPRCSVRKSTGDKAIDAIGCSAMTTCLPRFKPRLVAITADRTLDAPARDWAQANVSRELTGCVTSEHDRLIEELADRRYRARARTN